MNGSRRRLTAAAWLGLCLMVGAGVHVLAEDAPKREEAPRPGGLSKLRWRGLDIMKWTKDTVRRQPADLTVERLLDGIKASFNITHVGISIPMDASADYRGAKPGPRSAEEFTKFICEAIHRRGLGVLHRATWCGIEGLYDFPRCVGAKRFPAGEAAAVLKEAEEGLPKPDSWLAKTYLYIVAHPEFFADGDLWAPLPERTEGIFQDATSFLSYEKPGIAARYAAFFKDLAAVSAAAFRKIGKRVETGVTADNFSEAKSGWIPQALYDAAGIVCFDHYGITHTPEEMDADLRKVFEQRGRKPLFHQEWGDYWNEKMDEAQRRDYVRSMLNVWSKLADEGKLTGFSYWGGWTGKAEGVLLNTGTDEEPVFVPNPRGRILAEYFRP
jgi:hypothetical protein